MPIPQHQLDAIAASTVTAAPEIIIDGAKQAAREVGDTVAIFFDSAADEKYADYLGYNYCPLPGVDLLLHPLLGRVVAHVEPDGTITEIPAPEPLRFTSIRAIKHAYNTGAIRSRPAAVAVARLFPCLRRLYPASYDESAWMPGDLAAAALKLSTGEAECA